MQFWLGRDAPSDTMPLLAEQKLRRSIAWLVRGDMDRASTAFAIADAIRTFGAYRSTAIYDVDLARGLASSVGCSGPSFLTETLALRATTEPICKHLSSSSEAVSEITLPVLSPSNGRIIGTIRVEREFPSSFTLEEQLLLEECAAMLPKFWEAY